MNDGVKNISALLKIADSCSKRTNCVVTIKSAIFKLIKIHAQQTAKNNVVHPQIAPLAVETHK